MKERRPLLGVLGGLGPLSTFYFCDLLTRHTAAKCDRDHIDMIVSSRATTPDRTAFILGRSTADPLPVMREEAARLVRAGASLLVIPCNTAHYFYDGLADSTPVPILNIIRETVRLLSLRGIRRFGLLATEGTVKSRSYHRLCQPQGIECITPDEDGQHTVSSAIYDAVKKNRPIDTAALSTVIEHLVARGCECLILGCTELSVLDRTQLPAPEIIDALEVLAYRTILACGKTPIGFPSCFDLLKEDLV